MGLFVSDQAGVGDVEKAVGDVATAQDIIDSPIRVGDDRNAVARTDLLELFAGAGGDLVPIGGIADAGDELVAESIVIELELAEQIGVEHPPEVVVGAGVLCHLLVKLVLGAALEIAEKFGSGSETEGRKRCVDTLAVGEEQGIADIEEDDFDFRKHGPPADFHGFSVSRSVVSPSTAFRE